MNMAKTVVDPTYSEVKKSETEFEKSKEYIKYRRKWEENPKKHIVGDFPIHLDIESTSVCNLKCPMCFQSFNPPDKGFIDYDLFKKCIDEGVSKGLCSVKLMYRGEPLLHPRIEEMVKYCKEKGIIEVMFNTNATLLSKEKSRALIEAGLDKLICSVDGYTKEVYEKIRRGGKFETVLENIKNLQRLKKELGSEKPKVRIQMVDMPETHEYIEGYIKFWKEIGDDIAIEDLSDWNIQKEDYTALKDFACAQLWQRLIVLYNGDVLLCCADHFKEMVLGNAGKESISKIWKSPKLNQFRDLHINGESHKMKICRLCGLRAVMKKRKKIIKNEEMKE
ncbi:MAG: radical SAM protein [Nanoarchaeota archaeon]|nr:radical SAM protein [Nanoarchaeota archaeon]